LKTPVIPLSGMPNIYPIGRSALGDLYLYIKCVNGMEIIKIYKNQYIPICKQMWVAEKTKGPVDSAKAVLRSQKPMLGNDGMLGFLRHPNLRLLDEGISDEDYRRPTGTNLPRLVQVHWLRLCLCLVPTLLRENAYGSQIVSIDMDSHGELWKSKEEAVAVRGK